MEQEIKETNKNKILIIAIICVAVLAVIGILFATKVISFGGKKEENNEQQEKLDISDYVGRYDGYGEDEDKLEYFILNADGTANIHCITGDDPAYDDITSKYSIVKIDGIIVLKFDDYYGVDGLSWYNDYLDISEASYGHMMRPRKFGPSASNLAFCQADYIGKWVAKSSDPNEKEYFVLNVDGTATVHVITGDNGAYADYTVKYFIDSNDVLTFESYNDDGVPGWNILDDVGDKGYTVYKPRNIDQTPSALDLTFEREYE